MTNTRVVCFCNNVKSDKIVEAIKNGATTVEEVKDKTGAATGRCCGARCTKTIQELIDANK